MIRTHLPQPNEIDRLLLHIKGLVYARALLEENGASQVEIAEHTAELERQREQLAELVQVAAKSRQPRRTARTYDHGSGHAA
jgi:hypothetical protein